MQISSPESITILTEACPGYILNRQTPGGDSKLLRVLIKFTPLESLHYKRKSVGRLMTISSPPQLQCSLEACAGKFNLKAAKYDGQFRCKGHYVHLVGLQRVNDLQTNLANCPLQIQLIFALPSGINQGTLDIYLGHNDYKQTYYSTIHSVSVQALNYSIEHIQEFDPNKQYAFEQNGCPQPQLPISASTINATNFSELNLDINRLSSYVGPEVNETRKLYLCHDFNGGYMDDVWDSSGNDPVSYRPLYLHHAHTFNYFSHEAITIPPLKWRKLCQKYGVRCLGTFIVENGSVSQQAYFRPQFAYYLVYLCRICHFDGYLINIETPVQSPGGLLEWLQLLKDLLLCYIPKSVLVWYDSIDISTGAVYYQNALSQSGLPFAKACGRFFTNYWWDQKSINQTIQLARQQEGKVKVYIGNDCFGRGTYGGGGNNIYKAAKTIQQMSCRHNAHELIGMALFAPGFTFQSSPPCPNDPTAHLQSEQQLYRGLIVRNSPVEWEEVVSGGDGWEYNQDGWAVTSFEYCSRKFERSFELPARCEYLQVKFIVEVKATQPVQNSPYRVEMTLIDAETNQVIGQRGVDQDKLSVSSGIVEQYRIEWLPLATGSSLTIPRDTPRKLSVVIREIGKSSKWWKGYFGTRFKGERLTWTAYDPERDWLPKIDGEIIELQKYHMASFKGNSCLGYNCTNNSNGNASIQSVHNLQPLMNNKLKLDCFSMLPTISLNSPLNVEVDIRNNGALKFMSSCVQKDTNKLIMSFQLESILARIRLVDAPVNQGNFSVSMGDNCQLGITLVLQRNRFTQIDNISPLLQLYAPSKGIDVHSSRYRGVRVTNPSIVESLLSNNTFGYQNQTIETYSYTIPIGNLLYFDVKMTHQNQQCYWLHAMEINFLI